MTTVTNKQLYERNRVKAISTKVIPVVIYVMNVYKFLKKQLDELDKVMKLELRKVNMHVMLVSDERQYTSIEVEGRKVKSAKMFMRIQRLE